MMLFTRSLGGAAAAAIMLVPGCVDARGWSVVEVGYWGLVRVHHGGDESATPHEPYSQRPALLGAAFHPRQGVLTIAENGSSRIQSMDGTGSRDTSLPPISCAAWSDSGERLAVLPLRQSELLLLSADLRPVRTIPLKLDNVSDRMMSWSPDERRIAISPRADPFFEGYCTFVDMPDGTERHENLAAVLFISPKIIVALRDRSGIGVLELDDAGELRELRRVEGGRPLAANTEQGVFLCSQHGPRVLPTLWAFDMRLALHDVAGRVPVLFGAMPPLGSWVFLVRSDALR